MARAKKLTIILIKDTVKTFEDVLSKPANELSLKSHKLRDELSIRGRIFAKSSALRPVGWLGVLTALTSDRLTYLQSSSSSALLLVKVSKRIFAFTFGYFRHWIKQTAIERRFGLVVALNAIEPDSLRSVDTQTFDTISRRTRSQTSRATDFDSFGFNIARDLVRAVTGKSRFEWLGRHITGSDSISISRPLDISDLKELVANLLRLFEDTGYKERYPWIDNVEHIRDPELIRNLDSRLQAALSSPDDSDILLASPIDYAPDQFGGYIFSEDTKRVERSELEWDVYRSVRQDTGAVQIEETKKARIWVLDPNGNRIDDFSVYDALVFETTFSNTVHVLTYGEWFKVNENYAKQVHALLKAIPLATDLDFPSAQPMETEGNYNSRAVKTSKSGFALMDKSNVSYGGGKSKIEVCDLLTTAPDFVHVKKRSSASNLSHLFFQGFNSAALYREPDFRRLAKKKCPASHQAVFDSELVDPSKCRIVFAVIHKGKKSIKDDLPFFSQQSLVETDQRLRAMGYKVGVVGIPTK